MLLQGKNFMVMIDGKIPAAGTDCTLDTDVKTKEATPYKMSEGEFDDYTPESYGWSLSTENLVIATTDLTTLYTLQKSQVTNAAKAKIPVKLVEVEKGEDGAPKAKTGGLTCAGDGIITKLSTKFTNKEEVKLSINIQGCGDIEFS